MSEDVRLKVLAYLRLHAASGSSQYLDEAVLASKTGASADEVRLQLDILEASGMIESPNTFASHGAVISPRGMLYLEEAVRTMDSSSRRRIAFEPPGPPPGFEDEN